METIDDDEALTEPGNGHAVSIRHLERDLRDLRHEVREVRDTVARNAYYWRLAGIVVGFFALVGTVVLHYAVKVSVERVLAPASAPALAISVPWQRRLDEIRRVMRELPPDPAFWTSDGKPRVAELERRLPWLGTIATWERDGAAMLEERGVP